MGIFGNLFSKKVCDICGGEIGLFGNRKLEDGNCCKECAAKLSPWFSDRRQSTVEEIKSQLEYRERNKEAVRNFKNTKTLGNNTKVYLDENAGTFMITSARNIEEANPDVIKISQVTDCRLKIDENRDEVKREYKDSEGNTKRESYHPARYKFGYRFSMELKLNHPYFDEISFPLQSSEVEVDGYNPRDNFSGIRVSIGKAGSMDNDDRYAEGFVNAPTKEMRMSNMEYFELYKLGSDIEFALMQKPDLPEDIEKKLDEKSEEYERELEAEKEKMASIKASIEEKAKAAAAAAMAQPVICPWCGSKCAGGKFCTNCGGPLEGK